MKDNLKLWSKVEKTNPNYTKKANVKGNSITSIAPQFQIMNATEQFGVYGQTWGFRNMNIDYSLMDKGLVSFKAVFYFPDGEFETINSVALYRDNAMTKIDDNFAKKLETDTLTKALSKLGFNADIFLGKFDDVRYLAEVTEEFKPKPVPKVKEKLTDSGMVYLETKGTLEQLKASLETRTVTEVQRAAIEKLIKIFTDGTK